MKYAEQIMLEKARNQWFLWLSVDPANPDWQFRDSHIDWFKSNLVSYDPVLSMGDREWKGTLYHVGFDNDVDPRLISYVEIFEDAEGNSRYPGSYQMMEWSFRDWCEQKGPEEFETWMRQQAG